jgi:iron complex transport system substrate-binding protein
MRKVRILTLVMAALLILAAAGCAAKPKAGLKDFLDSPVVMQKFPARIVSLTPSNTEIVYALGLESKLVGVDAYSDYPEAAKSIAKIGDFNGPSVETIASLKPDLVLGGNKLQKDIIEKIKALGINVVAVEATSYADVYKSIELVGQLTGTEKKAKEVTADMKAKEKAVLDAVAKTASGKQVYYAMSFGEMGNWTAGPGSFPYELIAMCGGKNITEGMPVPWVQLNQEELVSKNPEIVLLSSDMGSDPAVFNTAEGYKDLKAVKDGQVFIITSNLCNRPGPRIVDGLREFAQFITGTAIKFPGE